MNEFIHPSSFRLHPCRQSLAPLPNPLPGLPGRGSKSMNRGIVILVFVAIGALRATAATTAPTTNPAILEAQKSVRAGHIVEIATRVEWRLGEQAKDFLHANPDELIALATLREFGRFFSRVNQPDE